MQSDIDAESKRSPALFGFSARSWRQRRDHGRALRAVVPRSAHADGGIPHDRDPIGILQQQAAARIPELIGIRHSRMAQTPFAFLRGAAAVMAADLVTTPVTGPQVQLCGDAHIRNFGTFGTPERNLTFSINDFDETLPGPWEWDLKRFAASLQVVAAEHGFSPSVCRELVIAAVQSYRERLARYAQMSTLEVWYDRKGVDDLLGHYGQNARSQIVRDIAKAHRREHDRAVAKLTETADRGVELVGEAGHAGGAVRFREDPPLQVHLSSSGQDADEVVGTFDSYRSSLSDDMKILMDRYQVVDVARRVVGVGSVGTLVWICLLEGSSRRGDERIVLQMKQAQASVLEPYLRPSQFARHGQRVIVGQRLTQGPTDIFLGWCDGPQNGRQYYVRQLWDRKGRSELTTMNQRGLKEHATLCAWALARAHARSGDPVVLSGYLGRSRTFDQAIATFAERYAACNATDHRELVTAIADGRLQGSDVI
ncbi:DUF2252 domain-containing protein [Jatrophihabitans sp. DSM 45814]